MQKTIEVVGIDQPVVLSRRKGTKNLRISIKGQGSVHVSVPYGIPEQAAKLFVRSKINWINKHLKPAKLIPDDSHIGKSHKLIVEYTDATRSSTKVTDTLITVRLPSSISSSSPEGQSIIKKACEKALLHESKNLLPQRLAQISKQVGIGYNKCSVKKLKSRWGACDNKKNISLNIYLIQLDWKLIDYVIYHELAHTKYAHHQKEFWDYVGAICPNYKELRKTLKTKPTDVLPTKF